MNWVKGSDNKEYLINKRNEFILKIEKSLGPRDSLYILGDVILSDVEFPHIQYSSDRKTVYVILTNNYKNSDNAELAEWQLMHESVHLIDPYSENTNVLEEALATWFQVNYNPNVSFSKRGMRYVEALKILKDIDLEKLFFIIKKSRSDFPRIKIGDIDLDFLFKHMPEIDENLAEKLCIRFSDLVLPPSSNTN